MKMVAICLWLTLALSQTAFAGEARSEEEKTFSINPGGSVSLTGDDGNIRVQAWEKPEVRLKITKLVWHPDKERAQELLDELEVEVTHSEDRLRIRERDLKHDRHFRFSDLFDPDAWDGLGYEVDYDLTVPMEIDLQIEHDEGDIEIAGVRGRLRLTVDEGEVILNDLETIEADIRGDEVDVEASNISGASTVMYIRVDEGRVRLQDGRFQRVDVRSDEADILLENMSLSKCDLETDEGDVEAQLEIISDGECRIQTEDGDVLLTLSEAPNLKFTGETREGRIRSDFSASVERWRNEGEKVDMTLGDGQARVDVYTHEGDIIIRRR